MHQTSELYNAIYADERHRKEVKLIIAGQEYTQDKIVSCAISGAVFGSPKIGGCASRKITLKVIPIGEIPRQAKIEVFIRLVLGEQASEWLPKGVFYFSTRKLDKKTGILTVKGFDAMLKANTRWLTSDYSDVDFPMPPITAVQDIAARMGVEVDERTTLLTAYPVEYPVDEQGDITMWDVLCYIAVPNAGNWIITDEGKLRLLAFGGIPTETNYLVTEKGYAITIGGVRILV